MNGGRYRDRARSLVHERFALVIVLVVVLVLAGGWMTYTTHLAGATTTEERVVSSWSTDGEFDHHATVETDTGPFSAGEELSDRSLYFTDATPVLEGTFTYQYATGEPADVAVTLEATRVYRSVSDTDQGTETHWEVTEPLERTDATGLEPGEPVAVDVALDVTDASTDLEALTDELGATPGTTDVLVRVDATVEGTVGGERVSTSETYDLLVEPGGSTYTVSPPADDGHTYETAESATVPVEPSPLRSVGSVGLLLASLLTGLAVGTVRYGPGAVPSGPVRAHERERAAFDDWITRGRVPESVLESSPLEVTSLEGLVDVAIDSDRRVIEDGRRGAYYVVVDDLVYRYGPPTPVGREPADGDE
ncbi:DUF5305 domain-containing protein [Natronobiforma cellulositropha]|uniref:DUF5305 domain-containing protein n=1 Tax=Natronobiforma cellulositropha TaxID=1679076 RepID=UPI0021D60E3C|nr:DUF5305 domain-containing protein [Natronobiforma cellulositropha]